jgi:hypothetical protein
MSRWHPAHAAVAAAGPGACGVWQLMQMVWAGTSRPSSVVLGPWQPMHALSVATKSWGWWQLRHASWAAGCGSFPCAWHDEQVVFATGAGWWAPWQSSHPFDPA